MRPPALSLDQLASLPVVYRAVIPPAYEDRQGHMNMRWYLALYDEAGDAMYPMLGLTADYFAASGAGGFELESVKNLTNRWKGSGCAQGRRLWLVHEHRPWSVVLYCGWNELWRAKWKT